MELAKLPDEIWLLIIAHANKYYRVTARLLRTRSEIINDILSLTNLTRLNITDDSQTQVFTQLVRLRDLIMAKKN